MKDVMEPEHAKSRRVDDVLKGLIAHPREHLIRRWNWKSALLSSLLRGAIFFSINLTVGWNAASGALLTEFVFRSATSGFYGSITEALCDVEPAWEGMVASMVLLPIVSHSLEFLVHWLRGTPKLGLSVAISIAFTALSTAFNLYAMRKGVLVVGAGRKSLRHDLRLIPRFIVSFIWAVICHAARIWNCAVRGLIESRAVRSNNLRSGEKKTLTSEVQLELD